MELIYGWISNFRNFKNEEFYFGDQFEISFDIVNNRISIKKNPNYIPIRSNSSNILNFNAIVGRNGVGKTNILDLIGSRFKDRQSADPNSKYFILYYSTKRNRFILEGNYFEVLYGIKRNEKLNIGYFESKSWYAAELEYELGELVYVEDYCYREDKTYIISLREKYDGNNYGRKSLEESDETKIMVQRRLSEDTPRSLLPKINMLISQLQIEEREMFCEEVYPFKITYNDFFESYYNGNVELQVFLKDLVSSSKSKNSKIIIAFVLYYFRRAILHKNINEEDEAKIFKKIFGKSDLDVDYKQYYWNLVESINEKILGETIDDLSIDYNKKQYFKFVEALEEEHGFDYYFGKENDFDEDGNLLLQITKNTKLEKGKDLIEVTVDSDRDSEKEQAANLFHDFFNSTFMYLSTGDQTYLDIFSALYEQLLNILPDAKHYIVLLDEPDRHMHPELATNFIHHLNLFISDNF